MKTSIGSDSPAKRAVSIRFIPKDGRAKIVPPVSEAEFSAKANALFYARHERVLYVGLGERAKIAPPTFRAAAGAAAMWLKKIGELHLALRLEEWAQFSGPAVEGVLLADYRFERFKTKKTPGLASLSVHVLASGRGHSQARCPARPDAGRGDQRRPRNRQPARQPPLSSHSGRACGEIGSSL